MGWLRRSGPGRFGKLAASLASWGTAPYHGRAFLADLQPEGFIAPSASISHQGLKLGRNVYIGDKVVASSSNDGGIVELGDRVQLYGDTFLETGSGGSIHIGEGTHVQPGCHIHAHLTEIRIGRNVEIASGCGFFSYDHGIEPGIPIMDQPITSKGGITVGDGAWLGYRVTVLQGVTIGAGAVIGAGSVVVRDIPENAIAAGTPAKVIKYRTIGHN
ncbi:MAG: acyltransferase [Luteolibacter sp.]|uniref:acyltransferase n=1 Tax=Luteolibacter sp. TaxID=1962973 RepID=UPI003264E7F4